MEKRGQGLLVAPPNLRRDMDDIYHHYDRALPSVTVKVEKNTKGFNFEVAVSDCSTVDEALAMIDEAVAKLNARLGREEK